MSEKLVPSTENAVEGAGITPYTLADAYREKVSHMHFNARHNFYATWIADTGVFSVIAGISGAVLSPHTLTPTLIDTAIGMGAGGTAGAVLFPAITIYHCVHDSLYLKRKHNREVQQQLLP